MTRTQCHNAWEAGGAGASSSPRAHRRDRAGACSAQVWGRCGRAGAEEANSAAQWAQRRKPRKCAGQRGARQGEARQGCYAAGVEAQRARQRRLQARAWQGRSAAEDEAPSERNGGSVTAKARQESEAGKAGLRRFGSTQTASATAEARG